MKQAIKGVPDWPLALALPWLLVLSIMALGCLMGCDDPNPWERRQQEAVKPPNEGQSTKGDKLPPKDEARMEPGKPVAVIELTMRKIEVAETYGEWARRSNLRECEAFRDWYFQADDAETVLPAVKATIKTCRRVEQAAAAKPDTTPPLPPEDKRRKP